MESNNTNSPIKAVILAGGSGTRLWPLSRLQLPKQFIRLLGDKTLLESTVDRLYPIIHSDDVMVVTGATHAEGEAYNSLQNFQTLLEPVGRNTAPAIALAAASIKQESEGEDPVMVVLPADHMIKSPEAFQEALGQAIRVANEGKLVTLGIKPTRVDIGFGYIKMDSETHQVESFKEKPDHATAEEYVRSGDYFWNSGMFVWKTSSILREIECHLPEVYSIAQAIVEHEKPFDMAVEELFPDMLDISIDHGVLEKSVNVSLVPCDIGWSDVGGWDAVHEVSNQDTNGNATQGRVIAKDCQNNLIHSNQRLVAAVGVSDLCVIETADAVLVTRRGESQRVREVVDALKQSNAQEHIHHLTIERPWGRYTILEDMPGFKIKRITVNPGGRLSLQRHYHRSEHWVVVSGTATVIQDQQVSTITQNQSTYIPIGSSHRLENRGKIALEIIEVQVGEYLAEDDIERLDDHYGRK